MRTAFVLLACVALVLSGCTESGGGGDEPADAGGGAGSGGSATGTGTGAPETAAPPEPAPAPTTHEVSLAGNAFDPPALTIRAGDSVHWTHRDGTSPHNVESDAPAFDSNPECTVPLPSSPFCMTDGDDFTYTFPDAGEVEYRCQVHSGMTGTISVTPS